MAFELNEQLLVELGLGGLSDVDQRLMLEHMYDTLEFRVGMAMAEDMSNDQLDEFEALLDGGDEDRALAWLEAEFPNYQDVVREELAGLKNEVAALADQILTIVSEDP